MEREKFVSGGEEGSAGGRDEEVCIYVAFIIKLISEDEYIVT